MIDTLIPRDNGLTAQGSRWKHRYDGNSPRRISKFAVFPSFFPSRRLHLYATYVKRACSRMANVLKPRNDQWSGRDSSKAILFAAEKYLEVDTREGCLQSAERPRQREKRVAQMIKQMIKCKFSRNYVLAIAPLVIQKSPNVPCISTRK